MARSEGTEKLEAKMFSVISAYLFGEETDECLEAMALSESEDVVDDWVFVNHGNVAGGSINPSNSQDIKPNKAGMDESWFVTPPSCFNCHTNKDKKKAQPICTLENLLIEHPSMSVYSPRRLKKNHSEETNGPSPTETAVRPVVNSKGPSTNCDSRRLRQGKIFLNQPVNKRVPLKAIGSNSSDAAAAFTLSRNGSKRANQVHARLLKGRHQKQHNRKAGKHVGMVAKRT